MSDDLPKPKRLRPHQLAWLRRPELDEPPNLEVWELPDGELITHDRSYGPLELIFYPAPRFCKPQ
jgi:hypothetical protein